MLHIHRELGGAGNTDCIFTSLHKDLGFAGQAVHLVARYNVFQFTVVNVVVFAVEFHTHLQPIFIQVHGMVAYVEAVPQLNNAPMEGFIRQIHGFDGVGQAFGSRFNAFEFVIGCVIACQRTATAFRNADRDFIFSLTVGAHFGRFGHRDQVIHRQRYVIALQRVQLDGKMFLGNAA